MERNKSVFDCICKEARRVEDVLSFVQQAANYNIENFPESNVSFWAKCFLYAEENGYTDERIEQVLRLNSFKKSNKISTLQHLGFAVYARLSNALQVANFREDYKAIPSSRTFLDSVTTIKGDFFDFINAGLYVMQPTFTENIGGVSFGVIKNPDTEKLDLDCYRNLVKEGSLELFQSKPPYLDILDKLLTGFSKEVLPQLGLEARHER